jgi:hypothetical protein
MSSKGPNTWRCYEKVVAVSEVYGRSEGIIIQDKILACRNIT